MSFKVFSLLSSRQALALLRLGCVPLMWSDLLEQMVKEHFSHPAASERGSRAGAENPLILRRFSAVHGISHPLGIRLCAYLRFGRYCFTLTAKGRHIPLLLRALGQNRIIESQGRASA